jgi:HD-GYP domain-containing protein (c-di-GMP phosphodiesterase class II)
MELQDIPFRAGDWRELIKRKAPIIRKSPDSKTDFLEKIPKSLKVKEIISDLPHFIPQKLQKKVVQALDKIIKDVKASQPINTKGLRSIVNEIIKEVDASEKKMLRLLNIRTQDDYIYTHSLNVCTLSVYLAKELGLDSQEIFDVGLGALLHDIGMLHVPKEIWGKPGRLTLKEEFERIKKHPYYGYEILEKDEGIGKMPKLITHQHHERFNGTGYPRGLKRGEIHDFSMIIALADVYDALTTDRTYRDRFLPYEAIGIILSSSPAFSSNIMKSFIRCMSIYPAGSLVRLNTGEIGVVIRPNKDMVLKPIIRLVLNEQGDEYPEIMEVNLTREPNKFIVSGVDDRVLRF